jgi:hypothetical protein
LNAFQQRVGGLYVVGARHVAPVRCAAPGGGEAAFDGGLQDAQAVALQLTLRRLQVGPSGVEVGEQLLDLRDDAALLGEGREWEFYLHHIALSN